MSPICSIFQVDHILIPSNTQPTLNRQVTLWLHWATKQSLVIFVHILFPLPKAPRCLGSATWAIHPSRRSSSNNMPAPGRERAWLPSVRIICILLCQIYWNSLLWSHVLCLLLYPMTYLAQIMNSTICLRMGDVNNRHVHRGMDRLTKCVLYRQQNIIQHQKKREKRKWKEIVTQSVTMMTLELLT